MSDIRAIDKTAHCDMGFAPSSGFLHTRALDRVSLLIAEIPLALMIYPLAFSQEREGLQLVAVLGGRAGQNDCLGEGGQWRVGYVPSLLRAWPFSPVEGSNGKPEVGFDHDSGLWRNKPDPVRGEKRFFDLGGDKTELLKKAEKFLRSCLTNKAITDAAVAELGKAGVLMPWRFPDAISDGTPPEGLLCVDQKKLHALDPQKLGHLLKSNALPIAYAQVFSLPRLQVLAGLRDRDHAQSGAGVQGLFASDEGDWDYLPD